MMKMSKIWGAASLAALLLMGCGDKETIDLSAPSMRILSLSQEPEAVTICGAMEDTVFTLRGGELLRAEVRFSDDEALSQFKIDIHQNFDCHGHGAGTAPGVSVPGVSSQTEDWSVLRLEGLSGQEQAATIELRAPEQVTAGNYHFQIQVLDESGNDNPFANFYSIQAYHPDDEVAPLLSVSEPSSSSFSVSKGSTVRFVGEVTDERSLSEGGNGQLFLSYTDLSSGNTFFANKAFPFDENVGKQHSFDFEYTIPQTLRTGDYRYQLSAHDGVRNVAVPTVFELSVR